MLHSIQPYQLNNKIIDVDLVQLPVISDKSQAILQKNLNIYLPPSLQNAAPLTDRIHKMEETAQKLQQATDNHKKDILIACAKTALLVALAAATVLLAVFLGPAFLAIGAVPFFILSAIFIYLAIYKGTTSSDQDINGSGLGAMFGLGLIIPLIEGCTRPYFINRDLHKQETEINTELDSFHAQNRTHLSEGYHFFNSWGQDMLSRLAHQIDEARNSLEVMQILPRRSPAGENEMQARLTELERARDEMSRVAQFYHKFDAI